MMGDLLIKIGEHFIAVHSESQKFEDWMKTYFQIIAQGKDAANLPFDLTLQIEEGFGVPFLNYHVEVESDTKKNVYRRADYRLEMSSDYHCANLFAYDELALKHALTNLYSAFIVHHHWGILIHSSCIDHQNKAYLFAGQSGAGKSTVARLSQPRPLLSDEATLIKIGACEMRVFDSPFRSEITTPYFRESCPLSSIHLLNQATIIETSLIKKSDALFNILDKVFFWPHDPTETAKVLQMCKQLVDQIPVYNLYFQKNNRFWERIS
jgi:hypothetical protein